MKTTGFWGFCFFSPAHDPVEAMLRYMTMLLNKNINKIKIKLKVKLKKKMQIKIEAMLRWYDDVAE